MKDHLQSGEQDLMKIVLFGPNRRIGALCGDVVVDLSVGGALLFRDRGRNADAGAVEDVLPSDLGRFIEGGRRTLDAAQEVIDHVLARGEEADGRSRASFPLAEVQLRAPRATEARIACAGGNFSDHAIAMAARMRGQQLSPEEGDALVRRGGIWGFWKVTRDPVDPEGDIIYPKKTQRLDYEGEVAIILSRPARDVPADRWREYVWGVTLFGDWSIRDLREAEQPYKFAMAKNFDTAYSLGPCVAVDEVDPASLNVETLVDGQVRQRYNTSRMVFSFGEFLEYLTADLTLYPGDIITGGTSSGTAQDSSARSEDGTTAPERFLHAGSAVEVRSDPIGSLRARVRGQ